MGITPQIAAGAESQMAVGFDSMTTNWAFVILYGVLIIALGGLIVRRLLRFKIRDFSFYLNHIGLWLTLLASGLGHADMERYVMHVNEGETEWRVYDIDQNIKELPIAIKLNDFAVEYYSSDWVVVDTQSGEVVANPSEDLVLGEKYRRVMLQPEPRSFISDVELFTQSGQTRITTIEVNKPLRVGAWMIYQYGYDNAAGAASAYSSFELVYDRWLWAVYTGIIMMMLGAVAMVINGRKKVEIKL
ncbi:MAG: cytochrome c biogenesis protein ResB [Rikenellaceae bacterium]